MRVAGIDIGSRTVKVVLLDGARPIAIRVAETGFRPLDTASRLLEGLAFDRIAATGYGRHFFQGRWRETTGAESGRGARRGGEAPDCIVITEIRAAALGARAAHPGCRTIIDIGGQDTKAIALDASGRVRKFVMNDRCAAGTGRFLEVMAVALECTPEELVDAARSAEKAAKLSSMCAVFAESEVVTLVSRGARRDEIALGIHQSVVERTSSLAGGIPIEDDVLFIGGGARNAALGPLLAAKLGRAVRVPESPQVIAAWGCALEAAERGASVDADS